MRLPLLTLAAMFKASLAWSQLAGTYTVGVGGDFEDIGVAVQAAVSDGLADSTLFLVAPDGTVPGTLYIPLLPGAASTRPLTIRSTEPDSTAVVLGRVELIEAAHIRFEGLTFATGQNPTQGALRLFRCRDIEFTRCRIQEMGTPAYAFSDALINVQLPSATPSGDIRFDRCVALSAGRVLRTMGAYGLLGFEQSSLEGVFVIPGGTKRFDDCDIRSLAVDDQGVERFLRCTFDSPSGRMYLRGELLQDCAFVCNVDLAVGETRGNVFRNVECFQGNGLFVGNQVDTARFIYTHGKPVIGNRFKGPVSTSGDQMRLYNNSFDVRLNINNGPGQIVRYNSFGPGALLWTYASGGLVEFNSLWDVDVFQHQSMILRNNNYAAPSSSNLYHASFDALPSFHNPLYDSSAGYWKATNLLLSGKSSFLTDWGVVDIDSVPRLLPGAAAANIICVAAAELPDTLRLVCGDRISLRLCPGQEQFVLTPLSGNGIIDMGTLPMDQGMYLYVSDTTGLLLDSCWLYREPYPDLGPVQLYAYCGFPVEVQALYPLFADSMRWEPAWLFDDPSQPFQTVQSDTTVLLTSTVFSAACGSFQQTFQLNIPAIPYAFFTEDIAIDTVRFEAWSSCCDSIHWDLGDGTYSTEANITHVYSSNGSYLVTLTCWLQGDSGVVFTYVSIQGVGLDEHATVILRAYPNPATNIVRVTGDADGTPVHAQLVDLLGRSVMEVRGTMPLTLDVGDLSPGRYTILLDRSDGRSSIPLIIQRE